jgi:hypothetical protein
VKMIAAKVQESMNARSVHVAGLAEAGAYAGVTATRSAARRTGLSARGVPAL